MRRFRKLVLSALLIAVLLTSRIVPIAPEIPSVFPETQPSETTLPPPPPTETTVPATEPPPPPTLPGLEVEDVSRYFREICLSAEFVNSGDPTVLQKWAGPVIYQLYGIPTIEDLDVLDAFIARVNQIPGFPGIRPAESPAEANLSIHFCSQEEIVPLLGENFHHSDGGVTFWYDGNNRIYQGIIAISTDTSQQLRNSVIQEELYNGLGPVQDTDLRPDSIIFSGFSQPQSPTDVDWLLLELLYHPALKCGMGAVQCDAVIRKLYQ